MTNRFGLVIIASMSPSLSKIKQANGLTNVEQYYHVAQQIGPTVGCGQFVVSNSFANRSSRGNSIRWLFRSARTYT